MVQQNIAGTSHSATLPPGFTISLFAQVPGARMMAVTSAEGVLVSQPSRGSVALIHSDGSVSTLLSGLNSPHGLAIDGSTLYVAETDAIRRYAFDAASGTASAGTVLIHGLPSGGNHPLKNIVVGPDHGLYIGIGSSCNACAPDAAGSTLRAAIYRLNPDGSGFRLFAQGLRNAEGLAFDPNSQALWAAVNNRDEILDPGGKLTRGYVDDHPPELFTAVRDGGNYGWPFCNSTQDSASANLNMPLLNDWELNAGGHVNCAAMDRVSVGIQAHSAPLGLHFATLPGPYGPTAVLALHGSWDRTEATGYKVVWLAGTQQFDLAAGFAGFARPVDTAVMKDGSLLISDDAGGAVFRMRWAPSAVSSASGYALIAPQSYATVYGTNLPNAPMSLTDSAGHTFTPEVIYRSASQINFIAPAGVASGTAHLAVGAMDLGTPEVRPVAPGLFAAVKLDGGLAAIYGTGLRGAAAKDVTATVGGVAARVLYVGPQPTYPALDQVNIAIPAGVSGPVVISAADLSTNSVLLPAD